MPTNFPLEAVADEGELANQLNDQELSLARQFVDVHGVTTGVATDKLNVLTIEFNVDADRLRRLNVIRVPTAATQATANAAAAAAADPTAAAAAAQDVKNKFKTFIGPLLDSAEMLDRAEVFLGDQTVEVVVMRTTNPSQPVALNGTPLKGKAGLPWTAQVVGDDIVVRGAKTTAFGGDDDKADNGQTACGFPTKGHPELFGCALPLGGRKLAALRGTPLPNMPFGLTSKGVINSGGAQVEVTDPVTGKQIKVPVIDLGPAISTGHALDLTVAAARAFKSNATANNFSMKVDYRIIGGARFIS